MQIIEMRLSDLKKSEKNVRVHTRKQLSEYERSVMKFGQTKPLVVDETNTILIGNGLYEAMLGLGMETASVMVYSGLSERDKKKLMIADNRIYSIGVDNTLVIEEILKEFEGDYDIPGYDDELLSQMFADAEEVTENIASYGTLDADKIEQIRNSAERYEARESSGFAPTPIPVRTMNETQDYPQFSQNGQNQPVAAQPNNFMPASFEAQNQPSFGPTEIGGSVAETRKSVICPKCGEVIWL